MGKPQSQDLRERVFGAIDNGEDAYEIAPLFNVSVSYIYKILERRRATGETTARPQRHGPLLKLTPYNDALRARVEAVPDSTIDELRLWLLSEHKLQVSNTCVWEQLRRLGLTLKKVAACGRARSVGRRASKGPVAPQSGFVGPCKAGLRRRDLGINQYDTRLRPVHTGRTPCGTSPVRPLERHYVYRWTSPRLPDGAVRN